MEINGLGVQGMNTQNMAQGPRHNPLKPLLDTVPEDQRDTVRQQLDSLDQEQRGILKQRLDELKPQAADMTREEIGAAFMDILSEVAATQSQGGGEPGAAGPMPHHPPPHMRLMEVLDANGNREIGTEELANATEALASLDENGDGVLTEDELRPQGNHRPPRGEGPEGHRPPPPPPSTLMTALDADQDGQLSSDELESAAETLLGLDQNGDGILSPEELRPQQEDGTGGPGEEV